MTHALSGLLKNHCSLLISHRNILSLISLQHGYQDAHARAPSTDKTASTFHYPMVSSIIYTK